MFCIILVFLIWNNTFITGFFIKSHFPASNSSHYPRLRMIQPLPSLQEFTVCSWLKYSNDNPVLTLISYATSNFHNQIMISLVRKDSNRYVRLFIGKPYTKFNCSWEWKSGKWYHLCVTWCSSIAIAKVYQNGGICKDEKTDIPFEKVIIPTGGILIIGQDQDGMDEGYKANEAWNGDIADVQIWNEALNIYQIREAGKCNGKRKAGNVFAWMKTEMIAIGNVVFSETQLCNP